MINKEVYETFEKILESQNKPISVKDFVKTIEEKDTIVIDARSQSSKWLYSEFMWNSIKINV